MAKRFEQYEIESTPPQETVGGFIVDEGGFKTSNTQVKSGGINDAGVRVGSGSTAGGINAAGSGSDIVFWAGNTHANRATAPFRVDANGNLNATSATISGFVLTTVLGGDGSDGALSIASGTTTINASGARVLLRNYTSISITGTGKLAFSNPHASGTIIILRSQGDVTLTSSTAPMIDASGMGATGGAGASSTGTADGTDGTDGLGALVKSNAGLKSTTTTNGNGGATTVTLTMDIFNSYILQKFNQVFVGSGGGGASISNVHGNGNAYTAASGGNGGGALIIECGGAWNFTTASGISVAGANGGNSPSDAGNAKVAGGGGGGGGGVFQGYYYSLTANSGSVVTSGGTGGNAHWTAGGGENAHGAGGGANPINAGSNGTTVAVDNTKSGGDGGAGYSTIQQFRI